MMSSRFRLHEPIEADDAKERFVFHDVPDDEVAHSKSAQPSPRNRCSPKQQPTLDGSTSIAEGALLQQRYEHEQRPPAPAHAAAETSKQVSISLRYVCRYVSTYRKRWELSRELLFYIPFLILFIFYEVIGLQVEHRFWLNRQVAGNLAEGQIGTKESIWQLRPGEVEGYHVMLDFTSIRNADEWHAWVHSVLLPELWDTGENPDANQTSPLSSRWIVGANRPLGSVRFRFLRVKGKSCRLNTDMFSSPLWSSVSYLNPQDGVGEGACYPPYDYDRINQSALVLMPSSVPRRSTVTHLPFVHCLTAGDSYLGRFSSYSCGGNVYDVPFSLSMNEARDELWRLRNSHQSSPAFGALHESLVDTRLIEVQFFTYTAALDLFTRVQCFTEVSVGGRLSSYVDATNFVLWTPSHAGFTAYFVFFMIVVFGYTLLIARHAREAHRQGEFVSTCLLSGWFFLDVVNLLIFYASFIVHMVWIGTSSANQVQVWSPSLAERDAYPQALESVAFLYQVELYFNVTNTILCFLKLIKFTSLNRSMSVVLRTLEEAKDSMLHILCIFLLVILAFAVGGTVFFGLSVPDSYGTVTRSFSSLLRLLVGDFDYSALRRVNSGIAGLFFWSYVILGLFLMLSFFVGTLAAVFDDVGSEVNEEKKRRRRLLQAARGVALNGGDDVRSNATTASVPLLLFKSPREALRRIATSVRRWVTAPYQLRKLHAALSAYRLEPTTQPSPSSSPVRSPSASSPASAESTTHRMVCRHDLRRLLEAHCGDPASSQVEDELLDLFWSAAYENYAFDHDVCAQEAFDENRELLKAAIDVVLHELFGLSSKKAAPADNDRDAAARSPVSNPYEDTQGGEVSSVWRELEERATGGSASDRATARHSAVKAILASASAAKEALQVRDMLLCEDRVMEQLASIDIAVARLEGNVMKAAAVVVERCAN